VALVDRPTAVRSLPSLRRSCILEAANGRRASPRTPGVSTEGCCNSALSEGASFLIGLRISYSCHMSDEKAALDEPQSKVPWRLALGLGLAALASSIYLALRPPQLPESGLDFVPSIDQRVRIEQLKSQISVKNRKFSLQDVKQRPNAELFTYIAATSTEPLVLAASLDAISHAYSSRSDAKALPTPDLEKILLKEAQSPTPEVANLAFQALRIPIMTESPRPELIVSLCELFGIFNQAPHKLAALEALNLLRPDQRPDRVLTTFRATLVAPEHYLVSTGLLAFGESLASLGAAPAEFKNLLGQTALALTGHADPGVRGRALHLLAHVEGLAPAGEVMAKSEELLADLNGYVRAEAAEALGRFAEVASIRKLVPLTRDLTSTQYELTGFLRLDGTSGSLVHMTLGRPRVAVVALFALRDWSVRAAERLGLPRLQLSMNGSVLSEEDVLANAERAETWARDIDAKLAQPISEKPAAK
jgi:hypothetical protein